MKFDLAPFERSFVGFDDFFNRFLASDQPQQNYPPYNIIRRDPGKSAIQVAVAGFSPDELNVDVVNGNLEISSAKSETQEIDNVDYQYRGIGFRSFKRVIGLADHVEVTSATLKDGILTVELEQIIPEALQPKKIAIKSV